MDNRAVAFFKEKGLESRIKKMNDSTASAIEAAYTLGVELSMIAKSLTFDTKKKPMLVVLAGDAKIDSKKFRHTFGIKSKMLDYEDVLAVTSYEVGGVCPFALDPSKIDVFLDISLQRSEYVYPGCGDLQTLVKVSIKELKEFSHFIDWIDIGKSWQD